MPYKSDDPFFAAMVSIQDEIALLVFKKTLLSNISNMCQVFSGTPSGVDKDFLKSIRILLGNVTSICR